MRKPESGLLLLYAMYVIIKTLEGSLTLKRDIVMERRIFLISIECLIFLALYFSTSSIAAVRGVHTPWLLTWWDEMVPFMPAFVWVYASAYFLCTVGICLAVWRVSDEDFKKVLLACYANLLLFSFFHFAFPRVAVKPFVSGESASGAALAMFQVLTTKYNTFPSAHVSNALVTAWAATKSYPRNRVLSIFLIADALAVTVSTVLVKEHTVFDMLGGVAVALVSIGLSWWVYRGK